MDKLLDKIKSAYTAGEINSYMAERLAKAAEFGMTDQLLDDALVDAKSASKAGVENEKDYAVRFFVNHFADSILNDTFGLSLKDDERPALCSYVLRVARDDDYACDNLTDYRVLIHKWLCDKHTKVAYPNIQGKFEREPEYDLTKWTTAARDVYELLNKQMPKDVALKAVTGKWDMDEQFKFQLWLNYYESGNTEKYNVKTAFKKEALDLADLNLPQSMLDPATRSNQLPDVLDRARHREQDKLDKQKETQESAQRYKMQMRSRLRALRKLLDKYNDILPHQDVENIQDEMYALDKSINKLNAYASMQDRTVLAANRLKKIGFTEGADFLLKVADDPVPVADPAPVAGENQAGEEVVESLPTPTTSPEPEIANPTALVNVQTIIHRLESISKQLKSRDTIRELASIDILLNELGMASYFPELTDAQSKLIESFGYASNKVESIVAKLRGSGGAGSITPRTDSQPQQPQQKMDADQLRTKPVGEAAKQLPTG